MMLMIMVLHDVDDGDVDGYDNNLAKNCYLYKYYHF